MSLDELNTLVGIEDKTITISHARDYFGGCIPGWQMFADAQGLNWKDVVRYGLKASILIATKDAMAVNLVKHVYGVK